MEQMPIGKGCPRLLLMGDGSMSPCKKWDCMFWRPLQITTTHPQTGDKISEQEWDCVDALNFIGILDVARKANQTGAAVEALRNTVAQKQAQLNAPVTTNEKLIFEVKK